MAESGQGENSSSSTKQEPCDRKIPDRSTQQNNHLQNDNHLDLDEESPLLINHKNMGIPSKGAVQSKFVDNVLAEFKDKDIVDKGLTAPLLVTPGGMPVILDRQGFISPGAHPSHMFVPPGDDQSKGLPSDATTYSPPPLQREELKTLLMHQLEYYFSKDNLGSDKYLLSQMDTQHFVPVNIVANFNQVKRLTSDLDLIIEVVKESPVLQLDNLGEKIRGIPEKRCILILREIPQETPEQDIMDLFTGVKCPKFISCEFAENSCWYVTFESEDDAQKAFSFLREEVRTFLGQPIRARIKGTIVQRSSGMPKKPRVNYPIQPMYNNGPARFYPQQSGVLPWSSPPAAATPASNGIPYYDRNNFFIPTSGGYMPSQFGPPARFQNSFSQPVSGGLTTPTEITERSSVSGRIPRSDRALSPTLSNGNERSMDRGNGNTRNGPREHSRGDHYEGSSSSSGHSGEKYYVKEDSIRKIPRLNKNRTTNRAPVGGPVANGSRENTDKEKPQPSQRQTRHQQSLDLAPVNFPPLPTTDNSSVSSPPTASTAVESESKGISNLADIVKGRRLKDGAPTLSSNGHPPLQQSNSANGTSSTIVQPSTQGYDSNTNTIVGSTPGPVSQAVESPTAKPITTNTTQTISQSITSAAVSSSGSSTTNTPLSIAAVVASNIPPPRTMSQVVSATLPSSTNSLTTTSTTGGTSAATTAASIVASRAQSTGNNGAAASGNSSGHHGQPPQGVVGNQGKSYQSKGQRNESKGAGYREGKSFANKYGPARYGDKDMTQSRQNNSRNSQVPKDGKDGRPAQSKRNRDGNKKQSGGPSSRNISAKQSPKPPKKDHPPQAPPPPPTLTNKDKGTHTSKSESENESVPSSSTQNDRKSEKLSYAQMAQRKKAPPSPVSPLPPIPSSKHNPNENTSENQPQPSVRAASAPTSPQGSKRSLISVPNVSKTSSGRSSPTLKPDPPKSSNQKPAPCTESGITYITDTNMSALTTPTNSSTFSKSAPTSPCKESVNAKNDVSNTSKSPAD